MASFDLDKPRYDQSTFSGRFRHFLDVIDPRTLFPKAFLGLSLEESLRLLDVYRAAGNQIPPGVTVEQLLLAKKIKEATVHPDTGQVIPMPFRMAGFVPFGIPIVVGMLLPNQTTFSTIFWQWINQSQNAAVNYANRNASSPVPTSKLIEGYLGAVTSAVGVALGLNQLVSRATIFSPTTRTIISRFVPFPAVATANVCNVVLMRRTELTTGIHVKTLDGRIVGTSRVAAKKALFETALTRVALPAPILLLPPIILAAIEKTPLFRRWPVLRLPVQTVVCTAAFGLALPLAISLFPQEGTIDAKDVEAEIRDKLMTGETKLYYNKGL